MVSPEQKFFATMIIITRLLAMFVGLMLIYAMSQSEYLVAAILVVLVIILEFILVPLFKREYRRR